MIHWLSNMIGAMAALGLIIAALVYMVSPKHGSELLKRVVVFLIGSLLSLCVLRQFAACLGVLSFLLLGMVIVIAAYLIREGRRGRPQRELGRRGAERTPLLPSNEENL
jgi:Ca2+/Na+ antiporter